MRIALVAESFYPAVDGTTTSVRAVADRLVDTGHQVLVVAPGPGVPSYRGARVVRVQRPGRSEQVRTALTRFRPDLVHVASPAALGRRALRHAESLGIATVVVQHSPLAVAGAERWCSSVARRADRVLVTARWMGARLAALDIAAGLWEPGVDTRAFTPGLRDPLVRANWARHGEVLVGHVGSLSDRTTARQLAEVATLPGTRLVVAGGGPLRDWLRQRVPSGRFLGELGTGDLALAIANLDLLAQPSRHDTCCHAIREAAASGVPAVAPACGGAPDVVRPLETGLLHDPDDRSGLLRAVDSLAADRRRDLLGRHARELAVRRPWHLAVDELVSRHYLPLLGPAAAA